MSSKKHPSDNVRLLDGVYLIKDGIVNADFRLRVDRIKVMFKFVGRKIAEITDMLDVQFLININMKDVVEEFLEETKTGFDYLRFWLQKILDKIDDYRD